MTTGTITKGNDLVADLYLREAKALGRTIKAMREAVSMTVGDTYAATGISCKHIRDIERGIPAFRSERDLLLRAFIWSLKH